MFRFIPKSQEARITRIFVLVGAVLVVQCICLLVKLYELAVEW